MILTFLLTLVYIVILGKDIVVPVLNSATRHEDVRGNGGIAPLFLTSAPDGCEWSASRPGFFTAAARAPGTHWIGDGWTS
jgi:hypothetical protein